MKWAADEVTDYMPHAKPDWRLPHAWLRTSDGHRLSSVDLAVDRLVLLTGADADHWATAVADLPVPVTVRRLGIDLVGGLDDIPRRIFGIEPSGAVLVRPNGHVGLPRTIRPDEPAKT